MYSTPPEGLPQMPTDANSAQAEKAWPDPFEPEPYEAAFMEHKVRHCCLAAS